MYSNLTSPEVKEHILHIKTGQKSLCYRRNVRSFFFFLALGVIIYSLSDYAVIGMCMVFVACSLLFLSMLSSLLFLACHGMLTDVPCMLTAGPCMLHICSLACSLLFLACSLLILHSYCFSGMLFIPVTSMFQHADYCSWHVRCFCKPTGNK